MPRHDLHLSRRERQIMDVLISRGQASAAEVRAAMPDAPSYSAVRALLRILEDKGHVRHRAEGARYIYVPRTSPEKARRSALQRVVSTFFGGSVKETVAALLDNEETKLSADDCRTLQKLIEQAKEEGR